jgi:hypothetical protein
MDVIPHPPSSPDLAPLPLFSVSPIEDNRHFDTTEVIEAEYQVVLYTHNVTSRLHVKRTEAL